jgi:RiboL-PSP-HEPN
MRLPRIDQAIEVCEAHLKSTDANGTEIEAFLARYLLIVTCAAFEEEIEKIILSRAARVNDPQIESFIRSSMKAIFRSLKIGDLAGLLGRFGANYKDRFQQAVTGTLAEQYFSNIIENRNTTAHRAGPNVTFREVVQFYEEAHTILDVISEVCSG